MSALEGADVPTGSAAPTRPPAGRSFIDRFREQHQQHADDHFDMPIPRWVVELDGERIPGVVVRYGRLSKKAINESQRITRDVDRANALLLTSACIEVFVHDPDTGRLRPARDGLDDDDPRPVRFDSRLAAAFDLPDEGEHSICLALYGNSPAVAMHATRLYAWSTGADLDEASPEEVDELVGESSAPTGSLS